MYGDIIHIYSMYGDLICQLYRDLSALSDGDLNGVCIVMIDISRLDDSANNLARTNRSNLSLLFRLNVSKERRVDLPDSYSGNL